MWVMWPLRSRCPYTASLILSESRHSPQRGPVINPIQPGPPIHCLNTWCITTPTPMHLPRIHPNMHAWARGRWCNRPFKHLKNGSAFQREEREPLATASVIIVSGWKSGDMSEGKQMNVQWRESPDDEWNLTQVHFWFIWIMSVYLCHTWNDRERWDEKKPCLFFY